MIAVAVDPVSAATVFYGVPLPKRIPTFRRKQTIKEYRPPVPADRAADIAFYTSTAWRACRKYVLMLFPLCLDCKGAANQVHHVIPRKQCPERALDPSNCISLCCSCHSKRTKKEQDAKRKDKQG